MKVLRRMYDIWWRVADSEHVKDALGTLDLPQKKARHGSLKAVPATNQLGVNVVNCFHFSRPPGKQAEADEPADT